MAVLMPALKCRVITLKGQEKWEDFEYESKGRETHLAFCFGLIFC